MNYMLLQGKTSARTAYCEDDFNTALSAFDETVSQTFGTAVKRSSAYELRPFHEEVKRNSLKKDKKDPIDTDRGSEPYGYSKRNQPWNHGDFISVYESKPNRTYMTEQTKSHFSGSGLTNGAYDQTETSPSRILRLGVRETKQMQPERSHQTSFPARSNLSGAPQAVENGWQTQSNLSVIEVIEVDADIDGIAVGMPDSRKLPVTPTAPRVCRTYSYFAKLKSGLREWIELQTNLLQQAELDQDSETEKVISGLLVLLKRRLKTITYLERDYMEYYKLYRKLRSSQKGRQSWYINRSPPTHEKKISKSALVLSSANESGCELESSDKIGRRPSATNLLRSVWGSSALSVLTSRHKQKPSSPPDSLEQSFETCASEHGPNSSHELKPKRQKSRSIVRASRAVKTESLLESNIKQEEYLKMQLCLIEAQMEYLSGTLKCEVIGISGTSLYINRDEFKIGIKHGPPTLPTLYELNGTKATLIPINKSTIQLNQKSTEEDKWTTHGRVQASQSISKRNQEHNKLCSSEGRQPYIFPKQIWDHSSHVFSLAIDSVLTLKASELKRFGKDDLLQHQAFDVIGLLKPKAYHLSTPLKHGDRVRFHWLMQWSPLADTDDLSLVYYTPSKLRQSDSSPSSFQSKRKSTSIRFLLNGNELSQADSRMIESSPAADGDRSTYSGRTSCASSSMDSSDNIIPSKLEKQGHDLDRIPNKPRSVTIISVRPRRLSERSSTRTTQLPQWISMPNLEKVTTQPRQVQETYHKTKFITITDASKRAKPIVEQSGSDLDLASEVPQPFHVVPRNVHSGSFCIRQNIQEKLEKIYCKLGLLQNASSICPLLLQQLKTSLNNLSTALEQVAPKTPTAKSQIHQVISKSARCDHPEQTKHRVGKVDTLTALWESFAFLEYSSPNQQKTRVSPNSSSSSSSSVLPSKSDCSDLICMPTQRLSSGSVQLDMVLDWHVDYIDRLLNHMSAQNYTNDDNLAESIESSFTRRLYNMLDGTRKPIDLVRTPVHAYLAAVALAGQVDVLSDLINVIKKINQDPATALHDYAAHIVGSQGSSRFRGVPQFMYQLVYPEQKTTSHMRQVEREPQLLLEVRPLQSKIIEFYREKLSASWPNVDAKKVVDTLIEDLLHVDVNGENLTSIPVTHLRQRLGLEARVDEHLRPIRLRNAEFGATLDGTLYEVLYYLAGQSYIRERLHGPSASQILSSLPYCKRSHSFLFGSWHQTETRVNSQIFPGSTAFNSVNLSENRQLPSPTYFSTHTWLAVASLRGSADREVALKSTNLLLQFDQELAEVLRTKRLSNSSIVRGDSERMGRLPVLFSAGPPVVLTEAFMDLVAQSEQPADFLPPMWTGLILGIEQRLMQDQRISGMEGLTLLIEQKYNNLNCGSRNLVNVGSKSQKEVFDLLSIMAAAKLFCYLRSSDLDQNVRNMAKYMMHKLEVQSNSSSRQVHSGREGQDYQPVRMIWSRLPARRS
ncbi:hypothetical protein EG68_04643 [Paragonimus skrjabini miyazakii]|uniref:Uncharacterized protein n=1 Tax=Paragonimus skrjabini miyazakii TaxID=59628 RepID=A0A8S9YFN7_9TREM|nr:hypothetical protein EG68_04643 [Paragonimus skrjabini miyazakii]